MPKNNKFCPSPPASVLETGTGIAILGDDHVQLKENSVVDNQPSDPSAIFPGGIVLFDTTPFGGAPASNNKIVENVAHGNLPADLIDLSGGTGNVFAENQCHTSNPAGLCRVGD
jgi:hypothetical protein